MTQELNWFSPTDPSRTEIANYSRLLMPYLVEAATVLNAQQFLEGDGSAERLPAPGPVPGADPLTIYHLGNSRMHVDIWRRAQADPGILVLHDINLVDLAQNDAEERGDYESWREVICAQYGEGVRELAARSEKWEEHEARDELAIHYPLFTPYVKHTLGVVVHSRYAEAQLRAQAPAALPVRQLYLPYPAPGPMPERDYGEPELRFIFCGHVGPNRRVDKFIRAWGQLPDPGRLRLDLFGNISMFKELTELAQDCGVSEQLHIHGFVEEEELDRALRRAHFALNLRWPTMGETSSSQLRYWSLGLPTIASDVGWYHEVPADCLMRVPVEGEVEALAGLLGRIVEDPAGHAGYGRAGRDYLKQVHSPRHYVDQLLDFTRDRVDALMTRTLDRDLVPTVAAMCEDYPTAALFDHALETAAALFGPRPTSK